MVAKIHQAAILKFEMIHHAYISKTVLLLFLIFGNNFHSELMPKWPVGSSMNMNLSGIQVYHMTSLLFSG